MARVSSIVFLAFIAVAGADNAKCVIQATSSAASVAQFGAWLYTTISKCEGVETGNIECSSDVLNTIAEVLEVSGQVVASVQSCQPHAENRDCTIKGLRLANGVTKLTATSLDISHSCEDFLQVSAPRKFPFAQNEECIDKISNLFNALAAAILGGKHISEHGCKTPQDCWAQSLDLLSVIMQMADDIWVIFTSKCVVSPESVPYSKCVEDVIDVVQEISEVGASSLTIGEACSPGGHRKYVSEVPPLTGVFGFSAVNIGLAALLPLTAIVAFALGRRAKNRVSEPTDDMEAHEPLTVE